VRTGTNKDEDVSFKPVDQQEVATNVTFTVVSPVTLEGMV